MPWYLRGLTLFLWLAVLISSWRAITLETVPPGRLPWIFGMLVGLQILLSFVMLKGVHKVQVRPEGLWYRRVVGKSKTIPWRSIDRVVNVQGTGRRGVKILSGRNKVVFTEAMSNFDPLVEEITARSGLPMEGSTERLTDPVVQNNVIYAYRVNKVTLDHLFLVYVGERGLQFLLVGGQQNAGDQAPLSEDPATYVKPVLLDKYAGVQLGERAALEVDPHNFRIPGSSIKSVVLRERRALTVGALPNSGYLYINPVDGKQTKFILIGKQDHDAIAAMLGAEGIRVERSNRASGG
jgi:hypothetical protein